MAKSRRRLPKKTQKAVDKELRKWYRQIGDSYFERTESITKNDKSNILKQKPHSSQLMLGI